MKIKSIILTCVLFLVSLSAYSQEEITGIFDVPFGTPKNEVIEKLEKFGYEYISFADKTIVVDNKYNTTYYDQLFSFCRFHFDKDNNLQAIVFWFKQSSIELLKMDFYKLLSILLTDNYKNKIVCTGENSYVIYSNPIIVINYTEELEAFYIGFSSYDFLDLN